MYVVDVSNTQSVLDIDEDFLRRVTEQTLEDERINQAEISLAIVDNLTIHDLNIRFLQHDYPTDVLSFLFESDGGDEEKARTSEPKGLTTGRRGAGKRIEGEIIVSAEMARDMALEYGWQPQDELVLYVVHGLLHLAGYDDLDEDEKRVMRGREREVLALWKLTPRYAEDASVDEAGP
jgi:probable rRNA maturation factor